MPATDSTKRSTVPSSADPARYLMGAGCRDHTAAPNRAVSDPSSFAGSGGLPQPHNAQKPPGNTAEVTSMSEDGLPVGVRTVSLDAECHPSSDWATLV